MPYYRCGNVLVPRAAGLETLPSVRKVMEKQIEQAIAVLVAAFPLAAVNVEVSRWSHTYGGEHKLYAPVWMASIVHDGTGTERCKSFRGESLAGVVGAAILGGAL